MFVKLSPGVKLGSFCKVVHHGGDRGVTGSCHEFWVDSDHSILIDCGLFQGEDAKKIGEKQWIDFDMSSIRALLVTHVHIDHVGRIPYLLGKGFEGPIFCSPASAKLLPLVLEDAMKIGFGAEPALVRSMLKKLKNLIQPLEMGRWAKLNLFGDDKRVRVRFQPAGHILGSAYIELDVKTPKHQERSLFSGDLGAPHAPLIRAPKRSEGADRVFLESTYGNRIHEGRAHRKEILKEVLLKALADRGTVIIPAFSIGRTQELLYEIEELIHRHRDRPVTKSLPWSELDIVVDSPLANRFTEVFKSLKPYWDLEAQKKVLAGRHPLSFANLTTIQSHRDHEKCVAHLSKTHRPTVVLAASGMCAGGRVVNYLKAMLEDPRHDILFVGYQARGTLGHQLQRMGPKGGKVKVEGESLKVRAKIHTIHGYSAHADSEDLFRFIATMKNRPKVVRLIHGDASAKLSLAKKLKEQDIFK